MYRSGMGRMGDEKMIVIFRIRACVCVCVSIVLLDLR